MDGRIIAFVALIALAGCAPVMEAERPTPTDVTQFSPGESRVDVVESLGAPETSVQDEGQSCDIYKLYTGGTSGAGKGAIIFGEAAADVFTLGLTEVVLTPTEALTKSQKHPFSFCYDRNDKLVSVTKNNTVVN